MAIKTTAFDVSHLKIVIVLNGYSPKKLNDDRTRFEIDREATQNISPHPHTTENNGLRTIDALFDSIVDPRKFSIASN